VTTDVMPLIVLLLGILLALMIVESVLNIISNKRKTTDEYDDVDDDF
jgi:hypothetical protein